MRHCGIHARKPVMWVSLVCCLAPLAHSKPAKKEKPKREWAYATVHSVDRADKTVVVTLKAKGAPRETIHYSDDTVFLSQRECEMDDLQEGMVVSASGKISEDKKSIEASVLVALPPERESRKVSFRKGFAIGPLKKEGWRWRLADENNSVDIVLRDKTSISRQETADEQILQSGAFGRWGLVREGDRTRARSVRINSKK